MILELVCRAAGATRNGWPRSSQPARDLAGLASSSESVKTRPLFVCFRLFVVVVVVADAAARWARRDRLPRAVRIKRPSASLLRIALPAN